MSLAGAPTRSTRSGRSTPRSTPAATSSTPPTPTRGRPRHRPRRAADRQGPEGPARRRHRRHQGRHDPRPPAVVADGRAPRAPARGLRGVAAGARDRPHRPLPVPPPRSEGPYAESIGTFKELQDEGKVRWVGISNARWPSSRWRSGIVDIVSVQNQLSLSYTGADRQGRGAGVHRPRHRLPTVVAVGRHRLLESAGGVDPVAAAAERTASRPSRSRWRGCCRSGRPSSRSPARAGPRRSPIRCAPPSSSSATPSARRSPRRSGSPSGGVTGAPDLARDTSRNASTASGASTSARSNAARGAGGRLIESSRGGRLAMPCAPPSLLALE